MNEYCQIEQVSHGVYRCSGCGETFHNIRLPLRRICPIHDESNGPGCCGQEPLSSPGKGAGREHPPIAVKAWHFFKAMGRHFAKGRKFVSETEYLERLSVCDACEYRDHKTCTHSNCGCHLPTKAKWESEDCPDDRWPRQDPPKQKTVEAIITAHKRPEYLDKLTNSLKLYAPDLKYRVVETEGNLSKGRNDGVKSSLADYILILEDDFEATEPIGIEKMIDVLDSNPEVGIVVGRLNNLGKEEDGACDIRLFRQQAELLNPPAAPWLTTDQGTRYRICDFGWNFLLARRDVLLEFPWDERLELQEHLAYFLKFKTAAKWRLAFTPDAMLYHHRARPSEEYNTDRLRARDFTPILLESYGFDQVKPAAHPAVNEDRPCVIVFGVGHSNTTITVRQLVELGWHTGPAVDERYAEDYRIREINRQIGKSGEHPGLDLQVAGELLASLPRPWVLKEPHFVRTLQHWLPVFAAYEPLLLLVTKDADILADSYKRRTEAHVAIETRQLEARTQFIRWPWGKLEISVSQIERAVEIFDVQRSRGQKSGA